MLLYTKKTTTKKQKQNQNIIKLIYLIYLFILTLKYRSAEKENIRPSEL